MRRKDSIVSIEDAIIKKKANKQKFWDLYNFEDVTTLKAAIETYFESMFTSREFFDAGWEKIKVFDNEWEEIAENDESIPSLPWLARWLLTTTFKLRDYRRYDDYRMVLDNAKQYIEEKIVEMTTRWVISVNRSKFLLKNTANWEESSTVKNVWWIDKTYNITIMQPSLAKPEPIPESKEWSMEVIKWE